MIWGSIGLRIAVPLNYILHTAYTSRRYTSAPSPRRTIETLLGNVCSKYGEFGAGKDTTYGSRLSLVTIL